MHLSPFPSTSTTQPLNRIGFFLLAFYDKDGYSSDSYAWGFGVLFSAMIALVGFFLWERRSTLASVVRKNKELEEDLLIALRETRKLEEQ